MYSLFIFVAGDSYHRFKPSQQQARTAMQQLLNDLVNSLDAELVGTILTFLEPEETERALTSNIVLSEEPPPRGEAPLPRERYVFSFLQANGVHLCRHHCAAKEKRECAECCIELWSCPRLVGRLQSPSSRLAVCCLLDDESCAVCGRVVCMDCSAPRECLSCGLSRFCWGTCVDENCYCEPLFWGGLV
jgi:hypothetical protein